MKNTDKLIFGAGIFGLYFALECAKKKERIIVLEYDSEIFSRATFVNQSRMHKGYHYPRSYATAIKSSQYFDRFINDFDFCINKAFKNIYAISNSFSWVNSIQYKQFCASINTKCKEIAINNYLKSEFCDGAFETEEYTFDVKLLKQYFLTELAKFDNCQIIYNSRTKNIKQENNHYIIEQMCGEKITTEFVLNSTYGSINQILNLAGQELLNIKYELCEIILCKTSENIKNVGITLMDGPFFSLIPFGKTNRHSLSSVQYTPHNTCNSFLPFFDCQKGLACSPQQLQNCNLCINKPESNWPFMYKQAKKYLNDDIEITYIKSLFSIKAILNSSEMDDSRPTVIKQFSRSPYFFSVLSGKINSIYDLDELLIL